MRLIYNGLEYVLVYITTNQWGIELSSNGLGDIRNGDAWREFERLITYSLNKDLKGNKKEKKILDYIFVAANWFPHHLHSRYHHPDCHHHRQ